MQERKRDGCATFQLLDSVFWVCRYILSFILGSRAIVVRERPGDPHMDSHWTLIYSLICHLVPLWE